MKNCIRFLFLLMSVISPESLAEDETIEKTEGSVPTEAHSDPVSKNESSENAPLEPTRVTPQPDAHRHASIIQHLTLHQRQHEIVQMLAEDMPFNGLFLQETTGNPQGGVLLLHDNEQHGHWPTTTGPLREYLPDYGWATLAIELPSQPRNVLPARHVYDIAAMEKNEEPATDNHTEPQDPKISDADIIVNAEKTDSTGIADNGNSEPAKADQQEETFDANTEPALPRLTNLPTIQPNSQTEQPQAESTNPSVEERYQTQMVARLKTAMAYLKQRGQHNRVIIAYGNSASWAVDYLLNQQQLLQAEGHNIAGHTLILIDAKQNRYNQLYLEKQLQQLEIPVLDLITEHSSVPYEKSKRRAGMMKHKQRSRYRQILLSAPDLQNANHHSLKRRIRGWLKHNAAGTELPTS